MYTKINSSCLKVIKFGNAPATFAGSSSLSANTAGNLVKKSSKITETRPVTPSDALTSIFNAKNAKLVSCHSDRSYKLNKPVIRQKMRAFFNLQATREFCAFYSISFPAGISDDDAFRLFNIWQTRCRQTYNLKSFIWVSERQGNGTIHFHLLTNTKMPIKEVNGFMAKSLEPLRHIYGWKKQTGSGYNGIDVDNVWYPKRRKAGQATQRRTRDDAARHVSQYVTKYVSKNNETFKHLAWHQSRDIAALFTDQCFDMDECTPLLSYFHATKDNWRKFDSEFVTVYLHPTVFDFTPWLQLNEVNENVYRYFHAQKLS